MRGKPTDAGHDRAPMRGKPTEVVLITRLRTFNKGNQALSAAWLELLRQAFPDSVIRVLERRPPHLLQYSLAQIARSRDPFRSFDELTTNLARLAPGAHFIADPDPDPRIVLDEASPVPMHFPALRQRLNLRGWAARAGRYRHAYLGRLAACQRARLVVVNPAGEFFPRSPEPAFYHLLDAHIAHKLGRPTAIVNHTMDIDDPTLRALIPRIYRDLTLVGFRDCKSVEAFRAMGGDLGNVVVTPDLALTSKVEPSGARRHGAVAVAINVPEAAERGYAAQWIDVIRGLQGKGFEVVLVSNELPSDQAFYEQLRRQLGVATEGQSLDFDRYAALLGTFDVVVTSRMHTGVLAMLGGAPIVPVEGASFKITGMVQELGLAMAVIRPPDPGWIDAVVAQAGAVRDQRAGVASEIAAKLEGIRVRIADSLVPRLRAAEAAAA
jgi:polysaccharide pyruvyl transferase WcaK-like protein